MGEKDQIVSIEEKVHFLRFYNIMISQRERKKRKIKEERNQMTGLNQEEQTFEEKAREEKSQALRGTTDSQAVMEL